MTHSQRLAWALLALLALPTPALADRIRLLETDREAAEARIEMVVGAKVEILTSAFIFGDDALTLTSLSLLRDAARRGLTVQVLVDAQWNKMPRAVEAHLLAEGIEIREYHPFRFDRLHWVTRRMHDKMVVVDGQELLAGGRNVESTYFGLGRQVRRRNYIDLDLQVAGDAAGEARGYFLRLWASGDVRPVQARAKPAAIEEAARGLDQYKAWLDVRIEEARNDPDRPPPNLVEVGAVHFLHDPVGKKKGRSPGVSDGLRVLLDSAQESVLIESPYLVPTKDVEESLRRAIARGVRVRILTNSLGTTDNLWPQSVYAGIKKDLVKLGVELWEYLGPECMHAKAALIDGKTGIVGSYNLDPRSERLNTELALVFQDPALAEEMRKTLDEHIAGSVRIDERGFPEGADEPYPGISRAKVLMLRLLRLIAPIIKNQV